MHIELTEMLRCPEAHREEMLVLSTGEVRDRMVRSGLLGCPVCHKEYPIGRGIVNFRRSRERVLKDTYRPPRCRRPTPGICRRCSSCRAQAGTSCSSEPPCVMPPSSAA
jgi:uncharacterized protein YbaR (Trm112 family)